MDPQSIRHLHALRNFIRNLVEQAEKSEGCECHRPPSLLLVGPPGVGKTFLVKQMSNVCEMPLFGVHSHQLTGPNALRNLFLQARSLDYPSLFFLDDIDFIFSNQDKEPAHSPLAQLLRQELYKQLGCRKLKIYDPSSIINPVKHPIKEREGEDTPDNNGLIVVAATSAPWRLYKMLVSNDNLPHWKQAYVANYPFAHQDHELLSRFRGVYLVGLPDKETRFHLLKTLLQKVQHNLTDKEIWIVAEKTEGFTPSDLMVVTKNLNYKQFAFLFSMAGVGGFQESSDDDSITSSDLTETDSETESNDDGTENSTGQPNEEDRSTTPGAPKEKIPTPVPGVSSTGKNTSSPSTAEGGKSVEDALAKLENDWASDEEEEKGLMKGTAFSSTPKKDSVKKRLVLEPIEPPLSDSGSPEPPKSNEDEDFKLLAEALNDLDEACGSYSPKKDGSSSDCDNTSNVSIVRMRPNSSPLLRGAATSVDLEKKVNNIDDTDSNEDDAKTLELLVFGPPDPMRNDNDAIDSDSDKEDGGGSQFRLSGRRVNFSNGISMGPLMVEVENFNPGSSTIDYDNSASATMTTLESKLPNSNNNYDEGGGGLSSNILKRLLSSSPLRDRDEGDGILNSLRELKDKVKLVESTKSNHYTEGMLGVYGEAEVRRSVPDIEHNSISAEEFCRSIIGLKTEAGPRFRRSLSPAIKNTLVGTRRSLSAGGTPQPSPAGSDSSSHLATDNSSDIGRRTCNGSSASRDSEINKTRDSDSPTIPSSDVSTATCNISGETLECHSDSEDRFQRLEKDLKKRRKEKGGTSEEELSNGGDETPTGVLQTFLNLNNLGEVSIKIITLEDVLNVVSKTKRSVSDEEIKQYTDFMVWFANVAKSACPHTSKGSVTDSSSGLNDSLGSSLDRRHFHKKRKGPLHKLGRFLLKALMLLLD